MVITGLVWGFAGDARCAYWCGPRGGDLLASGVRGAAAPWARRARARAERDRVAAWPLRAGRAVWLSGYARSEKITPGADPLVLVPTGGRASRLIFERGPGVCGAEPPRSSVPGRDRRPPARSDAARRPRSGQDKGRSGQDKGRSGQDKGPVLRPVDGLGVVSGCRGGSGGPAGA